MEISQQMPAPLSFIICLIKKEIWPYFSWPHQPTIGHPFPECCSWKELMVQPLQHCPCSGRKKDVNCFPSASIWAMSASHQSQYSCRENPMDRGAWQAAVCKESDMTERLSTTCQGQAGQEDPVRLKGVIESTNVTLHCLYPRVATPQMLGGWVLAQIFLVLPPSPAA